MLCYKAKGTRLSKFLCFVHLLSRNMGIQSLIVHDDLYLHYSFEQILAILTQNTTMQLRKQIPLSEIQIPSPKHIIIDCDAGGDDSQALILAMHFARRQGKKIIGITCVDGNAAVEDVAKNVLINVCLCKSEIPIYVGGHCGIMGAVHKDYYFSKDGLGLQQEGYIKKLKHQNRWKEHLIQQDQNAVDFIISAASKHPNDLGIIALGPLTNIALAYHLDNSTADKVSMVSIMGGSETGFGIREFFAAEFNFYGDPQAAKIALQVYKNVYLATFDLSFNTDQEQTLPLFEDESSQKSKFIHDIHGVILQTHRPSVCDPLACIPVFFPELMHGVYEVYGEVETTGKRTRGALVLDWHNLTQLPNRHKLRIITNVNMEKFIKLIHESYH